MVPPAEESEAVAQDPSEDGEEEEGALQDALDFLFKGRVEEVIPPEELGEFHDFIREEALRRRRFAVSFRLDCGCLAWIGYSLSNIVTHDEGMEFKANPLQTYIPDHEAEVEHPEGPTEDPPDEFDDWPIWPFEIYQDELDSELTDENADEFDEESGLDDELAEEFDEADDLAGIRQVAAMNDPEATSDE